MTSPLAPRTPDARYRDPLEEIWVLTAAKIGLEIARADDAYATTNGRGRLTLASAAALDPDDSLAQMILHEMCHSLVAGEESFGWVDWGLDNESERHQRFELATLRLQAALLEPLGLRWYFAPTTDYRAFYDALPRDPFEERSEGERESIVRARAAYARRDARPWGPHLMQALEASANVLAALRRVQLDGVRRAGAPLGAGEPEAFGTKTVAETPDTPSLASRLEEPAPKNRAHLPLHSSWRGTPSRSTCGQCAWLRKGQGERGRCLQSGLNLANDEPICERFESREKVTCLTCGACCREAYAVVAVSRRDPAVKSAGEHMIPTTQGFDLRRRGHRCAALEGGVELEPLRPFLGGDGPTEQISPPFLAPSPRPFTCSIYEQRPKTCRDFELHGPHCLTARRRVGLSL